MNMRPTVNFASAGLAICRQRIGVVTMPVAASWGSSVATAADEPLGVEVTPLAGYRIDGTFDVQESDDVYEFKDSSSFGLVLNLRDQANTQWENLYSQQNGTARKRILAALLALIGGLPGADILASRARIRSRRKPHSAIFGRLRHEYSISNPISGLRKFTWLRSRHQ